MYNSHRYGKQGDGIKGDGHKAWKYHNEMKIQVINMMY